jgi:hypothetical protein
MSALGQKRTFVEVGVIALAADSFQGLDSVNRARIAVSGKCFGLITSLLKFSEKISETGGRGSLEDVLFTEALPESVLNIG